MALQLNITKTTNFGDTKSFNNSYCKVHSISGNKNSLTVNVKFYPDELQNICIDTKSYTFSPSVNDGSDNFVKQAYEYIKTLPEFTGATDV